MAAAMMMETLSCASIVGKVSHSRPPHYDRLLPLNRVLVAKNRKVFRSASRRPLILRAQNSSSAQSQAPRAAVNGDPEKAKQCLKDLAETLVLPEGFLSTLPADLKVDLNDAAFALSSGQLNQECGERAGKVVMGLSRALEQADTQSAATLARDVPTLQDFLPSDPFSNAALGKRLQAAGRYLSSTGSYGDGELQKLSKALLAAGDALSLLSPKDDRPTPKSTTPVLKGDNMTWEIGHLLGLLLATSSVVYMSCLTYAAFFHPYFGTLQLEVTPQKAYTGAAIAFVFGILSWQFTSGIQASGVDTANYANSNSFSIATALRGTLLTGGYLCTGLSAFAAAGLLTLGTHLRDN